MWPAALATKLPHFGSSRVVGAIYRCGQLGRLDDSVRALLRRRCRGPAAALKRIAGEMDLLYITWPLHGDLLVLKGKRVR